jgi:fatty acid-binding protein DegV
MLLAIWDSPLSGMAASILGVKPIVHVTDHGKVEPIDRVRGRGRVLERLLELAAHRRTTWEGRRVAVLHGGCPDECAAFAAQVKERFHPADIVSMPIGATIGTYAAEGAILFSF